MSTFTHPSSAAPGFRRLKMARATMSTFSTFYAQHVLRHVLRPPPRRGLHVLVFHVSPKGKHLWPSQVKSRFTPQMTRKPNTQNTSPLMCLSGQPGLKVRLAASSKRDGNEWAWVVSVAPTAAAVWAERACEVACDAAQNSLL